MTAPLPLTVSDAVCLDDVDPNGLETTSDLQSLEQDVYHVLIETKGSNIDDTTRGIGIAGLLSQPTANLPGVAQEIESQLLQDDRIDGVTVTISFVPPGFILPDGSVFPAGGYVLEVDIQVDSTVVSLAYGYSPQTGVLPQ